MRPDLDPADLERFATLVREAARARLRRSDLWAAFATAFPARPQGAEERRWFRAVLDAAAADGVLRLPAPTGLGWDRTQEPALPASATVVRGPLPRRDTTWRRFPWHPALAWVAELRTLTPDQAAFLHRVHDGLRVNRFEEKAPLKYRSLELTGHEKRLQALARTTLFGEGRLSLELLGCLPEWLPLAIERVGTRPVALVVENAGPFEVVSRVLRDIPNPPYGAVAFGDGGRVERSLPRLGTVIPDLVRIEYLGDLDWPGLRIARGASRVAAATGLPVVVPAQAAYSAMLKAAEHLGVPDGWAGNSDKPPRNTNQLLTWVPVDVREQVRKILIAGHRLPEEVLGPKELRALWASAALGAQSGQ